MANGEGEPRERVRAIELLAAGFGLLRPSLGALMPVVVASWAASLGWMTYSQGREAELGLSRELVSALMGAAASALMVRLLLAPGTAWWRPDGGFLGYVAFSTVVGLPMLAVMGISGMATADPNAVPTTVVFGLLLLALATLYLAAKLSLWFVGVLIGVWCGPGESWRRTNGAVLAYILANIFISIPPMLGMALALGSNPSPSAEPGPVAIAVAQMFAVLAAVLAASVTAGLWKVRGPTSAPS